MKAVLICPADRAAVGGLAQAAPLSNVPLLGQGLVEYWLAHLADCGVERAVILAADRPDQVRLLVDSGIRWGLAVEVVAEPCELAPEQALAKYCGKVRSPKSEVQGPKPEARGSTPEAPNATVVLEREQSSDHEPGSIFCAVVDHFPALPKRPLFTSYAAWFAGLRAQLARDVGPERVGVRELQPGIRAGLHARISPKARLRPPCWVGSRVFIGAGASVGPNAILEDGAFVEPGATIAHSWIGPDTFVGRMAHVTHSLAWGNTLINWKTNSATKVPDAFLLCGMSVSRWGRQRFRGWFGRLTRRNSGHRPPQAAWRHFLINKGGLR